MYHHMESQARKILENGLLPADQINIEIFKEIIRKQSKVYSLAIVLAFFLGFCIAAPLYMVPEVGDIYAKQDRGKSTKHRSNYKFTLPAPRHLKRTRVKAI